VVGGCLLVVTNPIINKCVTSFSRRYFNGRA
jgi:hypothetical protein